MTTRHAGNTSSERITLPYLSVPAKMLITCIIATLAFAMLGALGQIIVHDIIPTFFSTDSGTHTASHPDMKEMPKEETESQRGDLFADLAPQKETADLPFYNNEQFVWTLRWTHIHLFGINMIFIFLGGVTLLLDGGARLRTYLIALPFAGIMIDILAMWLKAFVSPAFFWLHIPGGGLFALIFTYVFLRSLWEMWLKPIGNA